MFFFSPDTRILYAEEPSKLAAVSLNIAMQKANLNFVWKAIGKYNYEDILLFEAKIKDFQLDDKNNNEIENDCIEIDWEDVILWDDAENTIEDESHVSDV